MRRLEAEGGSERCAGERARLEDEREEDKTNEKDSGWRGRAIAKEKRELPRERGGGAEAGWRARVEDGREEDNKE